VGYEIFDKGDSLGTSQFVYNVNLIRALEGEIGRTIASLEPIESVRVHLVIPKKEMFSKAATEPSASVVLKIKGSQTLTKQEVAGISHIIATAVAGLKPERITILDSSGRPLKLAGGDDADMMSEGAADFQKSLEEKYQVMLESLIEKSVGVGKVKANVAAEINFDREVTNSEVYDPEGQVVRSRKVSEDTENNQEGKNALGVATNVPNAQGGGDGASSQRNRNRTNEVTNYEISKTITNKITESGRIKKLSIAILVDGTYTIKAAEGGNEQGFTYNPRPAEEVEKLKTLAASAVGLDPKRGDKIEVINLQFSEEFSALPQQEKPLAWLRNKLDNIVQTVVIGLVIVLIMLLIVRPVINRLLENRAATLEEKELEARLSGAALAQDIQNASQGSQIAEEEQVDEEEYLQKLLTPSKMDRKKVNLIKVINEMVEKHPEETVAAIRSWLYSGK
jgi:flagellar M-ring protein FliF